MPEGFCPSPPSKGSLVSSGFVPRSPPALEAQGDGRARDREEAVALPPANNRRKRARRPGAGEGGVRMGQGPATPAGDSPVPILALPHVRVPLQKERAAAPDPPPAWGRWGLVLAHAAHDVVRVARRRVCAVPGVPPAAWHAGRVARRWLSVARSPVRGVRRARPGARCVVCSPLTSRCLWP